MIRYAIFRGCTGDNYRKLPIMYMAYVRQQMVLYLIVQPADKPGKKPARWRIVTGSRQLVYRPIVGDKSFFVWQGKICTGHYMGGLEDNAYRKTGYKMHADKREDNNPGCKRYHDQRQYQGISVVYNLPANEFCKLISILILSTEEALILVSVEPNKILSSNP